MRLGQKIYFLTVRLLFHIICIALLLLFLLGSHPSNCLQKIWQNTFYFGIIPFCHHRHLASHVTTSGKGATIHQRIIAYFPPIPGYSRRFHCLYSHCLQLSPFHSTPELCLVSEYSTFSSSASSPRPTLQQLTMDQIILKSPWLELTWPASTSETKSTAPGSPQNSSI
jgi:hypothetical protein